MQPHDSQKQTGEKSEEVCFHTSSQFSWDLTLLLGIPLPEISTCITFLFNFPGYFLNNKNIYLCFHFFMGNRIEYSLLDTFLFSLSLVWWPLPICTYKASSIFTYLCIYVCM